MYPSINNVIYKFSSIFNMDTIYCFISPLLTVCVQFPPVLSYDMGVTVTSVADSIDFIENQSIIMNTVINILITTLENY